MKTDTSNLHNDRIKQKGVSFDYLIIIKESKLTPVCFKRKGPKLIPICLNLPFCAFEVSVFFLYHNKGIKIDTSLLYKRRIKTDIYLL